MHGSFCARQRAEIFVLHPPHKTLIRKKMKRLKSILFYHNYQSYILKSRSKRAKGFGSVIIIYQIIIILMACSCVYKKYTSNSFKINTVNRLLNPNLDLDELFIETCARSAKTFLFFWRPFMYFLMSLSPCPWLSNIHYVVCIYKVPYYCSL